ALRNPPSLVVTPPLPCDLAHVLSVEIEGVPGTLAAGSVVLSGQGLARAENTAARDYPLRLRAEVAQELIDRPGVRRIRARLAADPDCGWGEPDVRSIWPGEVVTEWVEGSVVRRWAAVSLRARSSPRIAPPRPAARRRGPLRSGWRSRRSRARRCRRPCRAPRLCGRWAGPA